jgi:ribosomal protein S18 acetylase RimI-like enzyme
LLYVAKGKENQQAISFYQKLGFVLNLTSYSGKLEKIIKDKINNNNNKINNNNNDSPII